MRNEKLAKRASKLRLKIEGDLPNIFQKLGIIFVVSLGLIPLLFFYFLYVNNEIFINDYREILKRSFATKLDSEIDQLPQIDSLNVPYGEIIQLVALQTVLIGTLLAIFLIVDVFKLFLKGHSIYFAAYASRAIKVIVYRIVYARTMIFRDIRPYMFYSEEAVSTRSKFTLFRKALWFTLVIFAASFQFAGLIFIRGNGFPSFFEAFDDTLGASVGFMVLTGFFWLSLLLGIDLLERYDVRVLDLSRTRLMNIGKELGKISRNGFNFLTVSFLVIVSNQADADDWIQPVVFMDIFFIISVWILLSYESNLEPIGKFIRKDMDYRTLSGAERYVVNLERKRFGARKIKEAEESMLVSEKRVKIAHEVTFARGLLQSIVVTFLVILLATGIIALSLLRVSDPSLEQLLSIELLAAFIIIVLVIIISDNTEHIEIVRKELFWFPFFIIGNVIVTYTYFEFDIVTDNTNLYTLIIFEILWTILIYRHTASKMPGWEFWKYSRSLFYGLVLFILMGITLAFQIYLLDYFGFELNL